MCIRVRSNTLRTVFQNQSLVPRLIPFPKRRIENVSINVLAASTSILVQYCHKCTCGVCIHHNFAISVLSSTTCVLQRLSIWIELARSLQKIHHSVEFLKVLLKIMAVMRKKWWYLFSSTEHKLSVTQYLNYRSSDVDILVKT